MILEVAILTVIPNKTSEFESNFSKAKHIIASMKGFVSLQLQQCLETPNQYILLVEWETLENHTIGFRQSEQYIEWKNLLHHFYNPFPKVEHYKKVNLK